MHRVRDNLMPAASASWPVCRLPVLLVALPAAVGAKGEVAGNRLRSLSDSEYRAFLWTPATGIVDIGSGGGTPIGLAMTPALHMAGFINLANRPQQAMSWTPATGTRNLGTLGWCRSSRTASVRAGIRLASPALPPSCVAETDEV